MLTGKQNYRHVFYALYRTLSHQYSHIHHAYDVQLCSVRRFHVLCVMHFYRNDCILHDHALYIQITSFLLCLQDLAYFK